MARLHWINAPLTGRLAIMARPRAGDWLEDEIADWKRSGVDTIVCLLEPEEVVELGLLQEVTLCEAANMEYVSFPIPDRGVPASLRLAQALGERIAAAVDSGRSIAVHCRAGIGRSSMIAACALVCSGVNADRALALIGEARGVDVPDTQEQRDWVETFEKVRRSAEIFQAGDGPT
jgi:protein-tyrosine phosphatase